ncbi:MAG: AtpZ/AtpI family protein [Ignavibacteriales bacterium]|nr:AtpZ/AtpI family protein [Ignavibacteriales bacterium]
MSIEQKSTEKISQSFKNVGPYLGLGTQLAASIIFMFFLGRWLDEKFNSTPLMILICSFIGGFAGIYNFIHTVLQLNQKKKIDRKK